MNPVVHFELPAEDLTRMADFYTKVFGWDTKVMGEEYGGYVTADTTESTPQGPTKPGAINGGFYKKDPKKNATQPSVVISVDDIKAHMKVVEDAGGKVEGEPVEIPNVGWFVAFVDTEGNRLSMLQPTPRG